MTGAGFVAKLQVAQDTSAADWLIECFDEQATGPPTVRELLPDTFESYARILHPIYRSVSEQEYEFIPWMTVARWTGRTAHPAMQFERIIQPKPGIHAFWGNLQEPPGLTDQALESLVDILRRATQTAHKCWFGFWDGLIPKPGSSGLLGLVSKEEMTAPPRVAHSMASEPFADVPRVQVADRDYVLFQGPIEAILGFPLPVRGRPNLWWPEDRAWCVASDIELFDTYVGSARKCVEAILQAPMLEALRAHPDMRVDLEADSLNA